MPLITINNTFIFSGRFSTVGFSAEDVTFAIVVIIVALEVAVLLTMVDEDVNSIGGRLVVVAAITFSMALANALILRTVYRCGEWFLLRNLPAVLDFVLIESPRERECRWTD